MNDNITLPRSVVEQALESLLNEGNFRKLMKPLIEESIKQIKAALEQHPAADQQPSAPDGWKLVPAEPNEEMLQSGKSAHYEAEQKVLEPGAWDAGGFASRAVRAAYVYRAMLAAAPQPPVVEQQVADHQHKLIAISDELAAGAIAALTSYCNTGEIDGADDLLAELLFERDHQPVVEQEPAAWMFHAGDVWKFRWHHFNRPMGEDALKHWKPLYTRPQPPRQPLTRQQIQNIVMEVCDTIYPQDHTSHSEADSVFYGAFVNAIERAHDIK